MVYVNGIEIEENLPQSVVDDEPEGRFSDSAKLIMGRKYLITDSNLTPVETIKERIIRIAQAMAEPERVFGGDSAYHQWLEKFYHAIAQQEFSPGGRIWSNAGTSIKQLFNCFVFPQAQDLPGIMKTLTDTALTHKEGGGTGFNFSIVPPKGMEYNGIISPGAVITIDNIDVETETICQGNRRGANMGVLDYNHPDIIDFIYAKRDRREIKDKTALEAKVTEVVSDLLGRLRLDYDSEIVESDVRSLVDSSLTETTYAKRVNVAALVPSNLEERLVDENLFPVINPLTKAPLTEEELAVYAGNVEKNKAALGPDSIIPLSISEDGTVINAHTGNSIGVTKNGEIYMEFEKVSAELASLGIPLVEEALPGQIEIGDDLKSIFDSIGESAVIHSQGNPTTLNFSRLRSKGSPVRKGAAISSGVRSFVRNFDTAAWMYLQDPQVTSNAAIQIDHPDLLDVASLRSTYWRLDRPKSFVEAIAGYVRTKAIEEHGEAILPNLEGLESSIVKIIRGMPQEQIREAHKLKNFNVSTLVDKEFVEALQQDSTFPLRYDGKDFTREDLEAAIKNAEKAKIWLDSEADPSLRLDGNKVIETYSGREIGVVEDDIVRINARTFFGIIVENAHATADPGLLFHFNMNKNVQIAGENYGATNPCGEIPLWWYEACDLGSVNAKAMVRVGSDGKPEFDEGKLYKTAAVGQRLLDNVHDANQGPIPEVEESSRTNRRTGLGVFGWANLLADLWIPYDSDEAIVLAERFGSVMDKASYEASLQLAKEKGPFPNFEISTFDQTRPQRNIARLAIAPTGTISMVFDVNSSIEPFYSLAYKKKMRGGDSVFYSVAEFEKTAREWGFYTEELIRDIHANHGSVQGMNNVPEEVQRVFRTSHEITPEWHIRTQAAFQKYIDNAVSKTINMPNSATVEDVRDAYLLAMESGLKGITVYRDGSRDEQILVA